MPFDVSLPSAPGHEVTLDAVTYEDQMVVVCTCGWDASRPKHQPSVALAFEVVGEIAAHIGEHALDADGAGEGKSRP